MATGGMIRVLLVDDHSIIREGLRSFLQSYPDVDVVGEAANGEEAILSVARLQPSVVVMDVNIPKIDGIATTREIKSQYPHVAVVGLTISAPGYASDSMQKAGACEVLTKGEDAVDGLYQAIKKAASSPEPVVTSGQSSKTDQLASPIQNA